MRKNNDRGRDLWEDDGFIDINSDSSAPPVRPPKGRPPQRPQAKAQARAQAGRRKSPPASAGAGQAPARKSRPPRPAPRPPSPLRDYEGFEEYGRPRRPSGGPESRRNPTPPRKPRPKARNPIGGKARRMIVAVTVLSMAVITALLCIFLLFKVSEIQITGDKVYEDSAILNICGYRAGDNLVFLTTADREKALKEQLPYIAEVEISRHLPGTLEIHITGAQVASCVSSGGSWLYASGGGKILERKDAPKDGVMQVVGLVPLDTEPGQNIRVEDEGVMSAYQEIVSRLVELKVVEKFTKLDLSDPFDIRLWYEDRVEFKLGNAAELSYKVEFGCRLVEDPTKIGLKDRGILDLSYADVNRSHFEMETATPSPSPDAPASSGGDGASSASGGRDGIPDSLFTGSSDEAGDGADPGDGGDTGDSGDAGDTGDAGEGDYDGGFDTWDDGGAWDENGADGGGTEGLDETGGEWYGDAGEDAG